MEGKRQQTLFAILHEVETQAGQVEEVRPQQTAVLEDADAAALLHDEEPSGAVTGIGHIQRFGETGDDAAKEEATRVHGSGREAHAVEQFQDRLCACGWRPGRSPQPRRCYQIAAGPAQALTRES